MRATVHAAADKKERQWEQKRFGKWKWGISITISHAAAEERRGGISNWGSIGGMSHVKGQSINDVCTEREGKTPEAYFSKEGCTSFIW